MGLAHVQVNRHCPLPPATATRTMPRGSVFTVIKPPGATLTSTLDLFRTTSRLVVSSEASPLPSLIAVRLDFLFVAACTGHCFHSLSSMPSNTAKPHTYEDYGGMSHPAIPTTAPLRITPKKMMKQQLIEDHEPERVVITQILEPPTSKPSPKEVAHHILPFFIICLSHALLDY